jgi:Arm DNA-binding domain
VPLSTDREVRTAKVGEHSIAHAPGLLLRVHLASNDLLTRSWILRLMVGDQRRRLGLGSFPDTTLALAVRKAADARERLARGDDPSVSVQRRQRASLAARSLTLSGTIDRYLAEAAPTYKNAKGESGRRRALNVSFAPLHAKDVTEITAVDVARILKSLKPETARKAHAAIRSVFDFGATVLEPHGVTMVNPANLQRLKFLGWSPLPANERGQHAALDWRVVPQLVAELTEQQDVAAACFAFIVSTTVRAKTARLTKWSDIDLKSRLWTPPLIDLKDGKHHKRPFIIPLSDIAVRALEAMRECSSSRYVFGSPLREGDLTNLLRRLRHRHPDWVDVDSKEPFTIHGTARASFRTWVEDKHRLEGPIAEACLGHKIGVGEVESRYIRTGLVEEKRLLLDRWGDHCSSKSADIIQLPRRA